MLRIPQFNVIPMLHLIKYDFIFNGTFFCYNLKIILLKSEERYFNAKKKLVAKIWKLPQLWRLILQM